MSLNKLRRRIDRLLDKRNRILHRLKEESSLYILSKQRVKLTNEALLIVQTVAQRDQQRSHQQIASVVTRALESTFDGKYQFKIQFDKKRGKTEAKLQFLEDGNTINPKSAGSGGVLDIAAFALRLACVMLSKPPKRRLVITDEPFRGVHKDRFPQLSELIGRLSRELEFQFIIVTQTDLEVGKIIQV